MLAMQTPHLLPLQLAHQTATTGGGKACRCLGRSTGGGHRSAAQAQAASLAAMQTGCALQHLAAAVQATRLSLAAAHLSLAVLHLHLLVQQAASLARSSIALDGLSATTALQPAKSRGRTTLTSAAAAHLLLQVEIAGSRGCHVSESSEARCQVVECLTCHPRHEAAARTTMLTAASA